MDLSEVKAFLKSLKLNDALTDDLANLVPEIRARLAMNIREANMLKRLLRIAVDCAEDREFREHRD